MLDADQLDNWHDNNAEAIGAAQEYVRRASKGLPPDRFTDGADGAKMVAQGIHAMLCIIAAQTDALEAMAADMQAKGADAMRVHSKDAKQ